MIKKDLRTINAEELEALRSRALGEVQKCHNISKVSRNLGINRQVLHKWMDNSNSFNGRNRGRPKRKLGEDDTHQVIHTIADSLPYNQEIFGIFWTASSVRELICDTFGTDFSAYLTRRWLLECGFFESRINGLFTEPLIDIGGKTVQMYADSYNMPCYVFWRASVNTIKGEFNFQCVSSKRGDLRFIGEDILETNVFLNKLQDVARRKIIVVCNKNCIISDLDIYKLSKDVVLIQKKQGKFRVTHSCLL